nr:PREDICTED: uncharacterized protein LOC108209240 [Daucus carota subsp. sativus]
MLPEVDLILNMPQKVLLLNDNRKLLIRSGIWRSHLNVQLLQGIKRITLKQMPLKPRLIWNKFPETMASCLLQVGHDIAYKLQACKLIRFRLNQKCKGDIV